MWGTPDCITDLSELDLDEITRHIFISDKAAAREKELLKILGVKAVVVAGTELMAHYPKDFDYLHVRVVDSQREDISQYFEQVSEFIEEHVAKGNGVLVHCAFGVSRSSTLVIAYLMKKLRIKYHEAFSFVKRKRTVVRPNGGF
jgi:protein-tyrosine phosphatase